MPGLGMGLCMSQELRLEQRLEQKLMLTQLLELRLGLQTEKGRNALFELFLLDKWKKLICENHFQSIDEFQKFLFKESQKARNVPALGQHKVNDLRKWGKISLPQLAKCIYQMVILRPSEANMEWVTSLLNMHALIAQAGEEPSLVWTVFLNNFVLEKYDNVSEPKSYFSNLMNILFSLTDGVAIIDTMDFSHGLVAKFNFKQSANLLKYGLDEIGNIQQGMSILTSELDELKAALTDYERYQLAIKLISQSIRYRSGEYVLYHLNTQQLNNLFDDQEFYNKLCSLKNLPAIVAMLIYSRFNFESAELKKIIDLLEQLLDNEDFKKSRDQKRQIWRGLNLVSHVDQPGRALLHLLDLAKNSEDLMRCLKALEQLSLRFGKKIDYPFEVTSTQGLVDLIEKGTKQVYSNILGLNGEELNILFGEMWQVLTRSRLLDMCFTYASLCQQNGYARGAEIASLIIKQAIQKRFTAWRYSHERFEEQLGWLEHVNTWKETHRKDIIVGMSNGTKERFAAISRIAFILAAKWQQIMGYSVNDIEGDIRNEYISIIDQLKSSATSAENRKKLGIRAGQIQEEYSLAGTIRDLCNIDETKFSMLNDINRFVQRIAKKLNNAEVSELVEQVMDLISKTEKEPLKNMSFYDSDLPYELMQVGTTPIKSCQRWNEWTSHNRCLPAYVADPNKKVLWARDNNCNIIARCILRILPYELKSKGENITLPLLLLERPYALGWSETINIGLLSWLVEKAEKISKENHTPVMIAFKDHDLEIVMAKALPKSKFKLTKLNLTLPHSFNDFEYSDTLGGDLSSGTSVTDIQVHSFLVGTETQDEE